jgi:hypothetical protein
MPVDSATTSIDGMGAATAAAPATIDGELQLLQCYRLTSRLGQFVLLR